MQWMKWKRGLVVAVLAMLIAPLAGCHYAHERRHDSYHYYYYDRDPGYYRDHHRYRR